MADMPGLMSRMLPLPVSVNEEDLANSILPYATQVSYCELSRIRFLDSGTA